ncbi:MAG: S1C family serine protease [Halobacteriota archaeon]
MSRRQVLIGLASTGLAGLAGCTGAPAGDVGTPTPTPSPTPSERSTPNSNPEARFAEVYERTIDSVAMVQTFGRFGPIGQGSGFVFRSDHLLTNEHVINGGTDVELQFPNNHWTTGEIIGADPYSDLAVVRADDLPTSATPLEPSQHRATIGQEVLALGNPFGLQESVSKGIVSGRNRSLPTGTGFSIPATIQTDASVNPGNSGGPLVTLDARYLGVITARAGQDIGFAVSWRLAERVAPNLLEDGSYEHPYMGVTLQRVTPPIAEANDLASVTGVIVVDVIPGDPAEGTLEGSPDETTVRGITVPVGGDVIVALDDVEIATDEELSTYLALHTRPGDSIDVTVIRDGERRTVTFELGNRPAP